MREAISEGHVYTTKFNGKLIVKKYEGALSVTVEFLDTGFECVTTSRRIRDGHVKDLFLKSVLGVGFLGGTEFKSRVGNKLTEEYSKWSAMISRCYNKKRSDFKYYGGRGVYVCEHWHNFQNFARWYSENKPSGLVKAELDKDILGDGSTYSPESCLIVSQDQNKKKAFSISCNLISPSGEIFNVYNVTDFCKKIGLSQSAISEVINKKRNHHKGWQLWQS